MRDSVSNHQQSLRTPASAIWRYHHHRTFRPMLNLAQLKELILISTPDDTSETVWKGKKRSASPRSNGKRPSKRARTSTGSVHNHDKDDSESSSSETLTPPTLSGVDGSYPQLKYNKAFFRSPAETVPIIRHLLEIQYTGATNADNNEEGDCNGGWKSEEEEFRAALVDLSSGFSEPRIIDLGGARLVEYDGHLVGVSDVLTRHTKEDGWLFLAPALTEGIDHDALDLSSSTVADLLLASDFLRLADKVSLNARLRAVILPSGPCDSNADDLPFRFQVELNIGLCLPQFFAPFSGKVNKKHVTLVEDAQRCLLHFAYGTNIPPPPPSFEGATNMSYFYSILGPAPSLESKLAEDAMQPVLLNPTLLPFQRRSVGWLLNREGKAVTQSGAIVLKTSSNEFSFWDTIEEGNHTWYYNRLSGVLSTTPPSVSASLGGILAEEPGLGKTLETIAMILLNPAPEDRNPTLTRWDPEARLQVKAIKTSLIVTPPALASQWIDELAAHAPSLKVLVYEGWAKVQVPINQSQLEEERLSELKISKPKPTIKGKKAPSTSKRRGKSKGQSAMDVDEADMTRDPDGRSLKWCEYVHQFDVVITTYQILRSDFNVARAAPVRPRREDVVYVNVERPRSPLVMVEWNRVIMDEVQMVGGGKTEDMVSLIPRLSSFAVSGTPARAQISDMLHVLKFLRVDDIIGSARMWNRLLKPAFAGEFAGFFQRYAVRTMKSSVKTELTIPQQTRYLVGIELGKVERHVYDQTFEAVLLQLGLDARGVAASDGWQVDGTVLRASLRRLRGICTHPQVGQLVKKKGDNLFKPGTLKSIDQVLESMKDQNWKNVIEDWKGKVQLMIRSAQLHQRDEDNPNRYQIALDTLLAAEQQIKDQITEIKNVLADHDEKGKILKEEAAALRKARQEALGARLPANDKGKGKAREVSEDLSEDEDDDDEDEHEDPEDKGLPKTPAGKQHKAQRGALKSRLREARLTLHRIKFLLGDVYHVLGGVHSTSEDAAYEAAEHIRRDLLKVTEDEAHGAMAFLSEDATLRRLDKDDLVIEVPYLDQGGIRSAELMEEANEIIEDVINDQSRLLWDWRARITNLLTQKLNPDGDAADGREYQRNLDNQGEAEAYMQLYAALLADRREALINERTLLAAHEVREKKLRKTLAAAKAANPFEDELAMVDVQPEQEVELSELSMKRKGILARLDGRAIKSIVIDLTGVAARITRDTDPEKILVKNAIADLRRLISEQTTLQDKLDADLALIRKAYNQRILYFRQLQEISDSVADVEWEEETVGDAIAACAAQTAELAAKINTDRARHRYLENLVDKDNVVDYDDEDQASCILCRCDFTRGFITHCAHIFCEGCMKAWLLRKEGKSCPVCRVPINTDTIQRFTVNAPADEPAPVRPINNEPAPQSRRKISYNMIDPKLFGEIQNVESYGDFGSKVQTLVRHLLYLQMEDPGAKSIVFSAWADSLHIVETALMNNGIRCLRIDQNSKGQSAAKKFKTDPEILVLLLHGERENAGLNVTCASRVFLLESVVHHSFEIQAIARIDRMGQTRATEVYCYYAEDTVERNILDLAARQGLSLYTKANSAGTLDVSSFAHENEKTKIDNSPVKKVQKGDFIFKIDDMLAILFPHMYEELDYLIPPEDMDSEMQDVTISSTSTSFPAAVGRSSYNTRQNAVAGPSRLRY